MPKSAFTAVILKNGGLLGGGPTPPAEVLPAPLYEVEVFNTFCQATAETGAWGESAYYMNHKANEVYNSQAPNGGRLGKGNPVLFIHAKFDTISATLGTHLSESMRKACENLTEVAVAAGHNVHWEKSDEVNAAIVRFLRQEAKNY